jgi:hypothetical protein
MARKRSSACTCTLVDAPVGGGGAAASVPSVPWASGVSVLAVGVGSVMGGKGGLSNTDMGDGVAYFKCPCIFNVCINSGIEANTLANLENNRLLYPESKRNG